MAERGHRSIGEVLTLLKEEFPDITISKIRFLESQGLVDPERTPSGYRKFYEPDVERLRWILRQQREHFLPLKVIKGRLAGEPSAGPAGPEPAVADVEADARSLPAAREDRTAVTAPARGRPAARAPARAVRAPAGAARAPTGSAAPASPARSATPAASPSAPATSQLSAGPSGVNLTLDELAAASGMAPERLRELERFGLITGRPVAGAVYYDEEALVVANVAAGFARFGVEARHLRVYKNSTERELGLFEQIVTPLLKQRNPQARRKAVESLEDLVTLGQSLRAAMLRQAVRGLTGG